MAEALTEDQINERIQAIHTKLGEITTNGKPSYTVDEHTYKWNEYYNFLMKQLEYYESLANSIPWEEETLGRDW